MFTYFNKLEPLRGSPMLDRIFLAFLALKRTQREKKNFSITVTVLQQKNKEGIFKSKGIILTNGSEQKSTSPQN